jgi:arylsulfatase A-like enzyme
MKITARLALAVVLQKASFLCVASPGTLNDFSRPNVLVILTDDQGYGDLGFHGNPKIRTPHLDRLARQSVRVERFYVSPVCSPTRSSLLTGRYNYRTGIVDTYLGRSMMHSDEVTLAEMLAPAGYHTALFGKWHLGDNYPMRAMDQGFQETLVLKGGGIGQPSDLPGGTNYFDPVLLRNGQPVKTQGYCSDVFTDAAIRYVTEHRAEKFFVWLAFNAPHTPLQVPERYHQTYKAMNLAHDQFPSPGHPLPGKANQDVTARVYGMVENIDDNVGRLLAKLDELGLATNTIVIFLTDNGPQQPRYNAGMLERKGSVHEGGIRVPFFVRWPVALRPDREVKQIAAHIDLAPTLLELCGVAKPAGMKFDGLSLAPLLRGDRVQWPDRTLYFQWHRGDEPRLYRAFAARTQLYKLVQPRGVDTNLTARPPLKLFDMQEDPLEMKDIAAAHPEVVERLRAGYEAWFKDVSGTRGFAPPRIFLGTTNENPVLLTRQDWRGPRTGWTPTALGHWEVQMARAGLYDVTLHFAPAPEPMVAQLTCGEVARRQDLAAGATRCNFDSVRLPQGPGRLATVLQTSTNSIGPGYLEVTWRGAE